MAARVSQTVIAALSLSGIAFTRASQVVVATLASAAPRVRSSQSAVEVLFNLSAEPARAGQSVLEILVWNYEVPMPALYPTLPGLGFSVIKRPKWFTGVGTSSSGREIRVAYAANPLWEWDLTYDYLPDGTALSVTSDLKTLLGFYLSQSGSLSGFQFEDPDDHSATGQPLGTTDGATTTWTLLRTYGAGGGTGSEPVGWLNTAQPFHAYLDGVLVDPGLYTLIISNGCGQQIRFLTAPAGGHALTVDMDYFYAVRFKDDTYDFEKFMDRLWSVKTITLMSLRN